MQTYFSFQQNRNYTWFSMKNPKKMKFFTKTNVIKNIKKFPFYAIFSKKTPQTQFFDRKKNTNRLSMSQATKLD